MSSGFTLAQLTQLFPGNEQNLAGTVLEQPVLGISTDSRTVKPGQVFLALQGENFDGHAFVAQALQQGAIAAIVNHQLATTTGKPSDREPPLLRVKNTLQAYQAIARWWRDQFTIPVIAVTGSVGKTTTKELIAAVLSRQGPVLKTQANYNNEIGVPKTLLELKPEHRYAVIEMGMRGPGEIALLTRIARPDIAVITNVGTAHIGRLGSEEAIARAKCELLADMPDTSIAILNHDNRRLIETAATVWSGPTLTYGLEGGDLHGQLLDTRTLSVAGQVFPLPLEGRHNALNYLAALAVAKALNIAWGQFSNSLTVQLPSGRAQRRVLRNDVVVLDETYNAGLESMLAALRLLAETPGQRHVAVLGTMKELGERSPEFHRQVGEAVRQLNLDALFILADDAAAQALATGAFPLPTRRFLDHEALAAYLKEWVQPGDRLLFKASRSVALDRVVEQFSSEKESCIRPDRQ